MNKQEVGVSFPLKGVDVTCEFGRQPGATAPDAANVRAFEPLTKRNRGGSRPGLSRYIDETVIGGFPVQHLNVLVDPTTTALNADADNQLPGFIPDPSTNNTFVRNPPGRYIPPRGGFRQPNRNVPTPPQSSNIQLVQQKNVSGGAMSGQQTITLDTQPGLGNLIVVFIATHDISGTPGGALPPRAGSVQSGGLVAYAHAGGGLYYAEQIGPQTNSGDSLSCWYKVATSGSSDQSVTFDLGASCNFQALAVEYSRNSSSPFATIGKWEKTDAFTPPNQTTTGDPVSATAVGELAICAFSGESSPAFDVTPASGFRLLLSGHTYASLIVMDRIPASFPGSVIPSYTWGTGGSGLVGQIGMTALFTKS